MFFNLTLQDILNLLKLCKNAYSPAVVCADVSFAENLTLWK